MLLSRQLSMEISREQVVLAHSALAEAAPKLNPGLVLVTGRCRTDAAEIVKGYGFENVRTVAEYARAHPHLHPLKHDKGTGGGGGGGGNGNDGDGNGNGNGNGNTNESTNDGNDGNGPSSSEVPPSWASEPVRAIFIVETPEVRESFFCIFFLFFSSFFFRSGKNKKTHSFSFSLFLSFFSFFLSFFLFLFFLSFFLSFLSFSLSLSLSPSIHQDWHEDLQILLDVLRSDGTPGRRASTASLSDGGSRTTGTGKKRQPVALYCCNFDFYFAAANAPPRFGPGAFLAALEALHAAADASAGIVPHFPLEIARHGKPHPPAYEIAVRKLDRLRRIEGAAEVDSVAPPLLPPLRHVYALGDNPASDVRGANAAGGPWRSVLVRTGVWKGTKRKERKEGEGEGKGEGEGEGGGGSIYERAENDERDPAHFVCEDAAEAVEMILTSNGC